MYNEVVNKAREQYSKALREIESRKLWYQKVNDTETNSVTINSYYHADYTADGGEAAHGGSGIGNSDAWIDGNEIHVWSRAEGPYGEYWAHGRVWDRFIYNADDHWVKVKLYYYLRGRLLALGGDNDISIYLRIYDVTTGTEVDKKLIFNNEGNAYYDNVLKSGQIYVYLKKGHTYDIELIAETGASAFYVSGALSDFGYWEFDGDWRWVKWYYDEVTWV